MPAAPLVAGAGYRASEVALNREHAPRWLRGAMTIALASAGADTAFVFMFDRVISATGKGAVLLGLVSSVAWIVLVLASVAAAAGGSRTALRRWRAIGALGVVGHVILGCIAFADDALARNLTKGDSAPATLDLMIRVLQAASVFGIGASIVMFAAARYHRDLPGWTATSRAAASRAPPAAPPSDGA